jgi:hypothetical protein
MPKENILKEIKNELISNGNEPRIDNLDQYISQNKLFSILFYSKIIPDFSSIIPLLNKIYEKFDSLKLIICICEDSEEEFNKTLSSIQDISCLILKYESNKRDILISTYNIITLPSLIILNKEGILIDSLNITQIINLKENDVEGWINRFIIVNKYELKKPELGQTTRISAHPHELIYSDQSMKPGYGKSGWICDICRKSYTAIDCNYFCILCGWDICNNCYNKNQNEY